ncbi:hypothetical protein FH972_001899 [Carpinus fangiana]|uniref:Uncharacterized protein n=1 Tax=Carpinus fangiana TaxID=176857 RepID=A0A5N6QFK9_9ROSI|nr:hypothetical protein FH972_001899 [Carpinus fangiana]
MVGAGTVVVSGGTGWWLASVLGGGGGDLVPWVAFDQPVFGWWALSVRSAGGVRRENIQQRKDEKGKVRLPLTEVRKGLRSSSIRWRGFGGDDLYPHFSDHRREREEGESLDEEDQTEKKGEK